MAKNDSGTKAEKEADKALTAARAAVYDAQRAVKRLEKKTRREADELAAALDQASADAKKAVQRAKRTARTAREQEGARGAEAAPPSPITGIPTFRDLRDRAKARGIQGYSRMNKAQLLHALGEG